METASKEGRVTVKRVFRPLLFFFKSTPGAVLIVTILLSLVVQVTTGHFYTQYNLMTFMRSASFVIIIGFGQSLILMLGGIDLSVAQISGVCSMTTAYMLTLTDMNPYVCIFLSILLGGIMGLFNGLVIVKLNLIPFIVTLATSSLYKGIIYVITEGMPITGIPESVTVIGQGSLWGLIPYPVIILIVICILLSLMLRYTAFGRHIYAVGSNEHAARIVGIRTGNVKIAVFMIAGIMAAIAGILMQFRLGAYQVRIGENWGMPSITAGVLGGISMKGGTGKIWSAVIGGLLISAISFTIGLMGISSYWEQIVTGGVVLAAVTLDSINQKKQNR